VNRFMLYVLLTFGLIGLYWMFHRRAMRLHAEVPWSEDVRTNIFDGMNAEFVLLSAAAQVSTARAIEALPPAPAPEPDGSPSDDYILRQWEAEDSSYTEWAAATPNECIVPMM